MPRQTLVDKFLAEPIRVGLGPFGRPCVMTRGDYRALCIALGETTAQADTSAFYPTLRAADVPADTSLVDALALCGEAA